MRYSDIHDLEGLDSARRQLSSRIEEKGREVTSLWMDMKEDYSPTGLLAYGIRKISGKIRYDRIALWAIRMIKRHL